MKVLVVSAGYSIYNSRGQLNSFLTHLSEKNLSEKGYELKFSDVTKDTWTVDREVEKLIWADTIIYIVPLMWYNIPSPLVRWFEQVLIIDKTFVIPDSYGEGGRVPAEKFMIVVTTNLKKSDLGKAFVLRNTPNIDDALQPLIMTNNYLSVRQQLPTFHADDVVDGDTSWIESAYLKHLDEVFD